MITIRDRILDYLGRHPEGADDDEITRALNLKYRQQANSRCRQLMSEGIVRRERVGGKIRNYLVRPDTTHRAPLSPQRSMDAVQHKGLPIGREANKNLTDIGFQEVGECVLDNGLKSGVRFLARRLADERVIYAYTVDGAVKYIGICDSTNTTLKKRLGRYQSMTGEGTNERITEAIRACLIRGQQVGILAFKPDTPLLFKSLEVDLVKGLENPLIQMLRPEWNIKE